MKLGHKLCLIVFTVVWLSSDVLGLCDHSTLHKIVQSWGNNFPTNILKQSVGVITYVYLSPVFITREDPKIYCLATKLAEDGTSATDIYVSRDMINRNTVHYNKFENSGKITMKSTGINDENQFVISFKNHVLTFWQCVPKDLSGKYDSLVGIAVDVAYMNVPEVQNEVGEARKTLEALGLDIGADLNPCTPQMVQDV